MKEISGEGEGKQYFELFAYPIIDAEGAVESVVEYARDITELVRKKEQLDKMLQILPEGFVIGKRRRRDYLCERIRRKNT